MSIEIRRLERYSLTLAVMRKRIESLIRDKDYYTLEEELRKAK